MPDIFLKKTTDYLDRPDHFTKDANQYKNQILSQLYKPFVQNSYYWLLLQIKDSAKLQALPIKLGQI